MIAGSRLPVLALVARPGTAREALPLLELLGVGLRVVSWHRPGPGLVGAPDAVLVTDPALLDGLPEVPTAVWADDRRALELPSGTIRLRWGIGAAGEQDADARGAADPAIVVPAAGIDVARWPAIAPLVRARWRRRLDLPDRLVLAVGSGRPADIATALGTATAAVVDRAHVPLALCLGTPTVTDPATAAALGLRAGVEVEVAEASDDADRLAGRLAMDPDRCARLSRLGRRAAERRLDLGRPAGELRRRLGLVGADARPHDPVDLVADRLAELTTPVGARIVDRAAAAMATLPVLPGARP